MNEEYNITDVELITDEEYQAAYDDYMVHKLQEERLDEEDEES